MFHLWKLRIWILEIEFRVQLIDNELMTTHI